VGGGGWGGGWGVGGGLAKNENALLDWRTVRRPCLTYAFSAFRGEIIQLEYSIQYMCQK